jgi:hypothetical protein
MSIAAYLPTRNKTTSVISTFGGINENIEAGTGEFADMKNMSTRDYPALSTRRARGEAIATYPGIKAFLIKNGKTFYIKGGKAYYGDTEVADVSDTEPKLVVGMGAYIVEFPDKFMYNTADGTLTRLEASYDQTATITLEALSYGSAYTKINATGIGDSFSTYDNVTIEGCSLEDYNATKIISDAGADYIVVTGALDEFDDVVTGQSSFTVTSYASTIGAVSIAEEMTTTQQTELVGKTVFIGSTKFSVKSIGTSKSFYINEASTSSIKPKKGQKVQATCKTQESGMTFKRKCPDIDFLVERDNRLWGCSSANHEIYSSKLGDPKNWYNYEGLSDDAYAATIASDGDFTGIGKYSSYLIFFKEDKAHILRGDKPSNYSISEKAMPGVKAGCDRSIGNIADALYYVGSDGVYAFTGGQPQKISENLTGSIADAVSSQYENKLYMSCKYAGAQSLLVYDPRYGIWDKEDDTVFKFAQLSSGMLHYIDISDNHLTIAGDTDEVIEWMAESADMSESSIDMKYISKIRLNVMMEVGSYVEVYAQFDSGDWVRKGYIMSTSHKTYNIPITPKRCSKWRFKLTGRGQFKLLAISRDVEGGSGNNGNIQVQYRH